MIVFNNRIITSLFGRENSKIKSVLFQIYSICILYFWRENSNFCNFFKTNHYIFIFGTKIQNSIFSFKQIILTVFLARKFKLWFFITELDTKAQNLKHHSSKYKKDAALLNATSWMAIGAGGTILFLVFFIWYKFLLWRFLTEKRPKAEKRALF